VVISRSDLISALNRNVNAANSRGRRNALKSLVARQREARSMVVALCCRIPPASLGARPWRAGSEADEKITPVAGRLFEGSNADQTIANDQDRVQPRRTCRLIERQANNSLERPQRQMIFSYGFFEGAGTTTRRQRLAVNTSGRCHIANAGAGPV
jgi:hypothetical protein